jgi:ABC-type antimicrobial peptide transport system permease subunit
MAVPLCTGSAIAKRLTWGYQAGGEALRGKDWLLLTGTSVFMGVVGLLAALGPARRGLRIDPLEAMRAE